MLRVSGFRCVGIGFIGTAGMQDSVLRDLQYPKELETRTACIEWPPAEATA